MTEPTPFTRRRMVAGTLGAVLATAAIFQIGRAQTQTGTPEASPSASTSTDSSNQESDRSTERATAAIAWATETITDAQGDRDAVAAQLDATTIDALLTQATALRDRAQQAVDGGDSAEAVRLALTAGSTAEAASDLIVAQLTYPGLPSQQARASRVLSRGYEAVQMATDETSTSTDTDVTFSITTAQAVYASAYELYTGGSYAQAMATARAAHRLAHTALLQTMSFGDGGLGDPDRVWLGEAGDDVGSQRGSSPGRRRVVEPGDGFFEGDPESDEPVTVPEPEF